MVFSMDELGFENSERILWLRGEGQKWAFILSAAREYGFEGIHLTPSLYRSFGLDVQKLPDSFDAFHLTYHLGGSHRLLWDSERLAFEQELDSAFRLAQRHGMRDISLHPPVTEGYTTEEKRRTEKQFSRLIGRWARDARALGFSLSLETHLYVPYFLFRDYAHLRAFLEEHRELGVLLDVSHNFFSGYSEEEMASAFDPAQVTALHLSDALRLPDGQLGQGTHLAVGEGAVNFEKILPHFSLLSRLSGEGNLFAALEIKAGNRQLADSLRQLRELVEPPVRAGGRRG